MSDTHCCAGLRLQTRLHDLGLLHRLSFQLWATLLQLMYLFMRPLLLKGVCLEDFLVRGFHLFELLLVTIVLASGLLLPASFTTCCKELGNEDILGGGVLVGVLVFV